MAWISRFIAFLAPRSAASVASSCDLENTASPFPNLLVPLLFLPMVEKVLLLDAPFFAVAPFPFFIEKEKGMMNFRCWWCWWRWSRQ